MRVSKKNKKLKKNLRKKIFEKDFKKVKEEIRTILAKVANLDRSVIREDVIIRDRLGIESLEAMEILAAIETRYNITIDSAKAFDVVTVKDLYKLVNSYLNNCYREKENCNEDSFNIAKR